MAVERPLDERHLAYLTKAEEARHVSLKHRLSEGRAAWGEIADEWQHLAEQILRMEKM